jgi:tetratricopeptide (TPR) repeat protein
MPSFGRVLHFPAPQSSTALGPDEARAQALDYLSHPCENRSASDLKKLENADFVLGFLDILRKEGNSSPERVFNEAVAAYGYLQGISSLGVFDERDYLLGEIALLAGNNGRLIGRLEEAENWFDLADFSFRRTINSAPLLNRVSHARLVLRYDLRRYGQVLTLLPSVISEYERLGMAVETSKAKYLEALTLKEAGQADRSFSCLLSLRDSFQTTEPSFRSLVLVEIAEEQARRGNREESLVAYQAALAAVEETGDPIATAQLTGSLGEAYRSRGEYAAAIGCLRSAAASFASLKMDAKVAYLRVVLAEALLAAGRSREAEWEILAALPVIEDQKMVVEGFAAVSLLRESVARRRTDPAALSELRQKLQAS